jgi:hypothetical protein
MPIKAWGWADTIQQQDNTCGTHFICILQAFFVIKKIIKKFIISRKRVPKFVQIEE